MAQALQLGFPVLLVLFLDFSAPVFLLCFALVAVHAWTSWLDTRYADGVRRVGPVERLRLVSTGTEATMTAIRLARGATGFGVRGNRRDGKR